MTQWIEKTRRDPIDQYLTKQLKTRAVIKQQQAPVHYHVEFYVEMIKHHPGPVNKVTGTGVALYKTFDLQLKVTVSFKPKWHTCNVQLYKLIILGTPLNAGEPGETGNQPVNLMRYLLQIIINA